MSDFFMRYRIKPNVWLNFSNEVQENKLRAFLKKNVLGTDNIVNVTRSVKEKNKEKKQTRAENIQKQSKKVK